MSPFQTVLTEIENLIPRLQSDQAFYLKGPGIIQTWLGRGFDPVADIIPVIRSVLAKNPSVRNIAYFTPAIEQAYFRRKESQPASTEVTPESLESRAKRIANVKAKYPNIHLPSEFRWLEQYEAIHGPVAV